MAFLAVGFARADEKAWFLKTNTEVLILVENVDYLLAADDDSQFTVVVKSGENVANVTSVKMVDVATGIETVGNSARERVVLPMRACNTLQLTGLAAGTVVDVYSVDGRLVKRATATGETLSVDVADMAKGTYVLKTKSSKVKFVKQ